MFNDKKTPPFYKKTLCKLVVEKFIFMGNKWVNIAMVASLRHCWVIDKPYTIFKQQGFKALQFVPDFDLQFGFLCTKTK